MQSRSRYAVAFIFLLLFVRLTTADTQKKLRVTGKLTRVMTIGGESTGWAIEFDSETTIDGKLFHSIEVAGPTDQFQTLENNRVTARGKLTYSHGVETGKRPVLKILSIKALKAQ